MTIIDGDATLGAIVTEHPVLAREFERFGLDYCCGGQRSLAEACTQAGLDLDEVTSTLRASGSGGAEPWADLGPAELVDHIESVHHDYLKEELPRLGALADKVAEVHGGRHPELAEVRETFVAIRAEIEPHLAKEEQVLFPMVRELAAADDAPSFHCGSLQNPISVMMFEHDELGGLLERMRDLTGGYEPPADGCASYQALYAGLAQLEADTHLHIHKENNVLFPAVVELETAKAC